MSKGNGDSTPTIIEGDIMIPEPRSSPSSVEMCSYALLTYLHMSDINKAKPVAMWLTKQRGASGGYHGTQVYVVINKCLLMNTKTTTLLAPT